MNRWTPTSWQNKCHAQPITYPSQTDVESVLNQLVKLPPLVSPEEIESLKKRLTGTSQGKYFLLQGGNCAESFGDCHVENITNQLEVLSQISSILTQGLRKPVIQVGRIAGQYAKPRSLDIEKRDDITLPSYRGDIINKTEFTLAARTPDPQLMLQGYHCAALTLNTIRFENKDFFTSHEALHLLYEQSLTHQLHGKWYNLSTHFPWIGMRTTHIDGAHIEYIRGIQNPIAIKVGPDIRANDLIDLITLLNPSNEPGRLTLICRLGRQNIENGLPPLIKAVDTSNSRVLWSCDPMHGNTRMTEKGIKTRYFDDILTELDYTLHIHKKMGTYLGGIHLELTSDDVTECIGGKSGLTEDDLKRSYKSLVDPRLNQEQALEIAQFIVMNY